MLERALQRAIEKIVAIFNSKYKLGQATVGMGVTLGAVALKYARNHPQKETVQGTDQQGKPCMLTLTKQKDIHVDEATNTVGDHGKGHNIAALYEDQFGRIFKRFDGQWHAWDASREAWT